VAKKRAGTQSSLGDALVRAGLVAPPPPPPPPSPKTVETFEEAVARGNAWLDALAADQRAALARDLEHCPRAVVVGQPVTPAEVDRISGELGFALPRSFRRFLTTLGQATFLNPWWDATTDPAALVAETQRWVSSERRSLERLLPEGAAEKCVYVCDFHNHDAHYFLSCAERNADGECPVHLLFHDEAELYDGTVGFEAWFSDKVTRTIDEAMDRIAKA
jgi:hypothetical protein